MKKYHCRRQTIVMGYHSSYLFPLPTQRVRGTPGRVNINGTQNEKKTYLLIFFSFFVQLVDTRRECLCISNVNKVR